MMTRGQAFLLKVGEDDGYHTIAGLRLSRISVNGDLVEQLGEGDWRTLSTGGGVRPVGLQAQGIFLGGKAESIARGAALAGAISPYELSFEDGKKLRGKFLIQRLDFAGDFNGERNYTLQLESSGEVQAA